MGVNANKDATVEAIRLIRNGLIDVNKLPTDPEVSGERLSFLMQMFIGNVPLHIMKESWSCANALLKWIQQPHLLFDEINSEKNPVDAILIDWEEQFALEDVDGLFLSYLVPVKKA